MSEDLEQISLKVPKDTYYLGLIRRVVTDLAQRAGFSTDAVGMIEMAVDEACTNAIKYSRPKGRLSPELEEIDLLVRIDGEALHIEMGYFGEPFPFEDYGNINLGEYLQCGAAGGLGIYIIKSFMDEVYYSHTPSVGNEISMVKFLKREEEASLRQ